MVADAIISTLLAIPVIYCVVRLAGFKNRSKILWGILATLAPVVFLLASVPIFVLLALLPSLRSNADKQSYLSSFTPQYDTYGKIILILSAVILNGLFYFGLYSKPIIPILQDVLIYVHVPLGLTAYSAVFAVFILSVVRYVVNMPIPRALIWLQLLSVVLLYLCVISGALWARSAWGTYWNWDPKETWSQIMLYVMVGTTTYLIRATPKRVKLLLFVGIQTLVVIFVFFVLPLIVPGLHNFSLL